MRAGEQPRRGVAAGSRERGAIHADVAAHPRHGDGRCPRGRGRRRGGPPRAQRPRQPGRAALCQAHALDSAAAPARRARQLVVMPQHAVPPPGPASPQPYERPAEPVPHRVRSNAPQHCHKAQPIRPRIPTLPIPSALQGKASRRPLPRRLGWACRGVLLMPVPNLQPIQTGLIPRRPLTPPLAPALLDAVASLEPSTDTQIDET
jgi:hypothetical protein